VKLREDHRVAMAELAVLASQLMPKSIDSR
jgi:hypothetical protein